MNIAGIVAEYNPFHKGHAYQIQKIREIYGEDCGIICVMSGDFVQRGEPAMFSKYARAEAAVRCGADLVLELPVHCSVASAERFAQGAVQILGRLGVVDFLVFGSESGEVDTLIETAQLLSGAAFDHKVKQCLETGCSYPAARSMALQELLNGRDVTVNPNDNLGVEYIRATQKFGYSMEPVAIRRIGAMHDTVSEGNIKSGSEIRSIVGSGLDYEAYIPSAAYAVYEKEMPIFSEQLDTAILSRLRMLRQSDFAMLPDAVEGLENRLSTACRTETSLQAIYDSVKSKRYTHARIRRMVMCAALGITKQDYTEDNLYARVLALNEQGGKILRMSDGRRRIDVISKPAAARELGVAQRRMFEKTALSHDLYVLGYNETELRRGEADWVTSPVFVR